MPIPSYQIRNILSFYVNSLARDNGGDMDASDSCGFAEKYRIRAEGKRKIVIQKVVDEIIAKITRIDPADSTFASPPDILPIKREKKGEPFSDRFEFAYYKIENDGEKRKSYFSLENGEKKASGSMEKS